MKQSDADPEQLKLVAAQLSALRDNPPTVMRSLLTWPGTPLLLLVGAVGTAILAWLVVVSDQMLTSHWPIGIASLIFGAFLRDFGLARRVKNIWPAQSHFIDWEKVDQFE
ncbi:MAG: hypothetical protein AAF394_15845 [Planctomycetota bacterium]